MKATVKIPNPKPKNWSVSGGDIETLFNNLNRHGWWGRYRSFEDKKPKKKGDKIIEVVITGSPTITMPKWKEYGKASKEEKKSWDNMYKALLKHENNHHKIFTDYAKEWKGELEGGDDLTKPDLEKAWKAFKKELQKRQNKYDAKTSHGEKEGVILMVP